MMWFDYRQEFNEIPKWAWTVELSRPFNNGKINTIRNGTQQHNNKTTIFSFLIQGEKKFPCRGGGGDPVLKRGMHIFENLKLPLTMPHPRADLLPQMSHSGGGGGEL